MAKKRKRPSGFPPVEPTTTKTPAAAALNKEAAGGIFGFFRDFGVRETIESILIAVVLALMFRAYEAEAFIIPTGSMAPTLQGHHMDVHCEKCGHRYQSGASSENSTRAVQDRIPVIYTYCPICSHRMHMDRKNNLDHMSNNGDRILVNKFVYDFKPPERWDVIVFKNPNNGKQNYIKRLVGLPGEYLLIENGDIYLFPDGGSAREIIRKPEDKVRVMLQLVDDTDHIARELRDANWPLRWNQRGSQTGWQSQFTKSKLGYFIEGNDQTNWLRYRHLKPRIADWQTISEGRTPTRISESSAGELITDHYCYNEHDLSQRNVLGNLLNVDPRRLRDRSMAAHWVGDLGLECWTEIESDQGTLSLDLVEGGAHFTCTIDVATGKASITCNDDNVQFVDSAGNTVATPTAQTSVKGSGDFHFMYANVDDQIHLWVNNRYVNFDAAQYQRTGDIIPTYSAQDPGDAEPLGIASTGLDMKVSRLKVHRDIYYTSTRDSNFIGNETTFPLGKLHQLYRSPEQWQTPSGKRIFTANKNQKSHMFELKEDQFLPMGDNSPASLDGRVWDGPRFVDRDMLIGRAMLIYWPHMLNSPIPKYTPNFRDMGFIR